ncbi:1-deoxy-D-xylulose-5-phosphate synthase [Geodermatophilus bullaregiensis]|uniref:1-deoxy-D-xylulose-5-phosphate synthase n=1 Tax=Geodermatophilus bullaregiensis TaxID=1564160 RepID=UPI0027DD9A78|nr:1-deoxy-D-xylulose-5-phosphate synthase [Geodermatophilus bullaregiensis]MBM7808081.1 1-deoxy-D-xylulose-5-phosphate synthase [Geodermatophilus bullaregiensis]
MTSSVQDLRGGLLAGIRQPADLRSLGAAELSLLAAEIRRTLVDSVSRTGGHLGSSLGVVELTLALHRVFNSPSDPILWDTGHQAYIHKLLTGRQAHFRTLRQPRGLSGYPRREESPHDWVENSHASTALSYADGLARALQLRGELGSTVVAVVGDGAFTGGMCWEGLNNLGAAPDRPVVVVLNDNGRSYAPTVGGLAAHLAGLPIGPSLFELMGLAYLGPVDGHDIGALEDTLSRARSLRAPVVVHVRTVKGRGHLPAETDPHDRQHTVCPPRTRSSRPTWTSVLAAELVEIGSRRPDVVALTAAMLEPTGLAPFATAFPDRAVDVGIAEQHAVTSAAGLAMGGMHPVVALYSTFLNRAFDQLLLDVGLHRLPVTFILDRAGITGSDGPSHNGMWDLSILGMVPGMRVAAPRDAARLGELLGEAVAHDGPTAVRFPKGSPGVELPALDRLGTADVLVSERHAEVLILAVGSLASAAVAAAERLRSAGVPTTVVDPRWVFPVAPGLAKAARHYRIVVTVEDNGAAGGFGDAVARTLRNAQVPVGLLTLGLRQEFMEVGEREAILAAHGLDAKGIATSVLRRLQPAAPIRAPR